MPKRTTKPGSETPADRTTLNVSLSTHQRRLVDEVVCSGEYVSASEVVRESLRIWETQRSARSRAVEWLRNEIQIGLDAVERGDTVDADVVFDELRRKIRAGAAPTKMGNRR